MDKILELAKEAPLPAVLLVVTLLLLPSISKIVDSLCGLIFNFVLLIFSVFRWKDIQEGKIMIKSDFRGAKLEIGNACLADDNSRSDDKSKTKEETPSISLSEKIINLNNSRKGGQS